MVEILDLLLLTDQVLKTPFILGFQRTQKRYEESQVQRQRRKQRKYQFVRNSISYLDL